MECAIAFRSTREMGNGLAPRMSPICPPLLAVEDRTNPIHGSDSFDPASRESHPASNSRDRPPKLVTSNGCMHAIAHRVHAIAEHIHAIGRRLHGLRGTHSGQSPRRDAGRQPYGARDESRESVLTPGVNRDAGSRRPPRTSREGLERATRFELATKSLGSSYSTN